MKEEKKWKQHMVRSTCLMMTLMMFSGCGKTSSAKGTEPQPETMAQRTVQAQEQTSETEKIMETTMIAATTAAVEGGDFSVLEPEVVGTEKIGCAWDGDYLKQPYYIAYPAGSDVNATERPCYLMDQNQKIVMKMPDAPEFPAYDDVIVLRNGIVMDYKGNVVFDPDKSGFDEVLRSESMDCNLLICVKDTRYYVVTPLTGDSVEAAVEAGQLDDALYCGNGYFLSTSSDVIFDANTNTEYKATQEDHSMPDFVKETGQYRYEVLDGKVIYYGTLQKHLNAMNYRYEMDPGEGVFRSVSWDEAMAVVESKSNNKLCTREVEHVYISPFVLLDLEDLIVIDLEKYVGTGSKTVFDNTVLRKFPNGNYLLKLVSDDKEAPVSYMIMEPSGKVCCQIKYTDGSLFPTREAENYDDDGDLTAFYRAGYETAAAGEPQEIFFVDSQGREQGSVTYPAGNKATLYPGNHSVFYVLEDTEARKTTCWFKNFESDQTWLLAVTPSDEVFGNGYDFDSVNEAYSIRCGDNYYRLTETGKLMQFGK